MPALKEAPPQTGLGPRDVYVANLRQRQEEYRRHTWRERLVGHGKWLTFLVGLAVGWLGFVLGWISGWWLLLPVACFSVLLFRHEGVIRDKYRAARGLAFHRSGLTRLDNQWQGRGRPGSQFLDESHPYAADLHLFGKKSLFELLCTARTSTGEATLASWLRATAGADEVVARQQAVAELRPLLELREELACLGDDVPEGVDFAAVARWGEAPPRLIPFWPRWLALVIGLCSVVTVVAWVIPDGWPPYAALVSMSLGMALAGWLFPRVHEVLRVVEKRSRDLSLLAHVLACLEKPTFHSPRLRELQGRLEASSEAAGQGLPPSQQIAQLGNLLDLLNSRRNQVFGLFALLLLWGTQMAYAIEKWRARSGRHIAGWLDVVGQFEALCALAAYSYENPDNPFPEIVTDSVCYEGEGLGHPLLARPVRNDVKLGGTLRLLVVSGSNMSGKSTYLRTIGINAVLALAGAPVMAHALRLSPLVLGATLRIEDSLHEGRSRFQAEILRLRQLVDLTHGSRPLLFLLDELFSGTNSHDRRSGAEALVRGLVESGAIGLITTHDLSLTDIAEQLGDRAANVHFADRFENGEMLFDYRLQPGVVRNSNALALMRAVGLKV